MTHVLALLLALSMPGHASPAPGIVVPYGTTSFGSIEPGVAGARDPGAEVEPPSDPWRPIPFLRRGGQVSYSSVPVIDIGGHGNPSPTPGDPASGSGGPAGGSYRGPGDTVGGGGGGGATPGSNGPSGGGGAGAPRGRPSGGGVAAGPSGGVPTGGSSLPNPVTLTTTTDDTWWLWWEFNKNEFLKPNRLGLVGLSTTGDDPDDAARLVVENARYGALPLFTRSARDGDAGVRAAALIALGRIGSSKAVAPLLAALSDSNQDVRHQAILALGATGAVEAIDPLLAIARTGSPDGDERRRVSPFARPLAIVALGLGRRHEFDDRIDVEIVKMIQARTRSDREEIGTAALVYATLAPSPELESYALSMAKDENEAPSVRCRAVESLRTSTSAEVLAALRHHLTDGRMDLRRSAALALGTFRHPGALPALMAACENETEPLTRGFLLVSIGRQGGDVAQAHLARTLEKGDAGSRRWAALALGMEARRAADREQAERLAAYVRVAREREKSRDGDGAFAIAAGLARDAHSRAWIVSLLREAADPRQRMYAATALALLGAAEDATALRERLAVETQPVARVAITDALGVLGHVADVPAMLGVLMQLDEPAMQGLAASAMASHGTREALVALDGVARLDGGSRVRRSAAIAGLGMILADQAPLTLAEVSRAANYTVFSEWVGGMFQSTL